MKIPKSTISSTQLSVLLFTGSVGSAIVFIPNPLSEAAGNDAWISLLLASAFGMLVLAGVLYLHDQHDGISLIAYSRRLIGNSLTIAAAIPIMGMLFFAISAIDSGIGDFLTSNMMDKTPAYVFNSISLIIAALTARAGISVTARMFVILVFLMVSFLIAVLILAIPLYDPGRLLPLWGEDFRPVFHGFFISAGFPFGEVALFSMVLPFVNRNEDRPINKKLYAAFSFTSLILIISTMCTTMAFGTAAAHFKYSLYRLASEIQIPEIFQRIEAIIGMTLILGSYMKATIFLIILNQIIAQLLRLQDDRFLSQAVGNVWSSYSQIVRTSSLKPGRMGLI
jgi:spore germination protein KB